MIRFQILKEIKSNKKYRECEITFEKYHEDLIDKKRKRKIFDLELIFKDLKKSF